MSSMVPILPGSDGKRRKPPTTAIRGRPQWQHSVADRLKLAQAAPAQGLALAQLAMPRHDDGVFGFSNMSTQARTQHEAQLALEAIDEAANHSAPGRFSPDEQRKLASKRAGVSKVAVDQQAARMGEDGPRRRRGSKDGTSSSDGDSGYHSGADEATDPHDGRPVREGRPEGAKPPTSNKRRRSDSDDDADDAPAPQRPRYPTPKVQIQERVDVSQLLPIQVQYQVHPPKERSDAWWVESFRRLYHQMEGVLAHYFTLHDISQSSGSPWALGMTPEFVRWAEQVAEPDWEAAGSSAGWDELLKDSTQRKWLLMAVLMKIFKVKIFNEYLFGASKAQKEACFTLDRAFLAREGFQRRLVMSTTARTVLGENVVPESFYPCVAKLSTQIFLMLQPLTTHLYALPPPAGKKLPSVADLHQSIHNLVSQAAYLAVCVRLSSSIMQFVDLPAGGDWHTDDMYSLETELYTQRKEDICAAFNTDTWIPWQKQLAAATDRVQHLHATEHERHTPAQVAARDAAEAQRHQANEAARAQGKPALQNLIPVAIPESRELVAARSALNKVTQDRPNVPSYTHQAKTKISVWPVIKRYKPGSDVEDQEPTKPLREKDGYRIVLIAKGAVVTKYGKQGEEPLHVWLEDWVEVKKHEASRTEARRTRGARAVGALKQTARTAAVLGGASLAGLTTAAWYNAAAEPWVMRDDLITSVYQFGKAMVGYVTGKMAV